MINFKISKKWITWISVSCVVLIAGGVGYFLGITSQQNPEGKHIADSSQVEVAKPSEEWYANLDNIVLKMETSLTDIKSKMDTLLHHPLQKFIVILLLSNLIVSILGFGGFAFYFWIKKQKG